MAKADDLAAELGEVEGGDGAGVGAGVGGVGVLSPEEDVWVGLEEGSGEGEEGGRGEDEKDCC